MKNNPYITVAYALPVLSWYPIGTPPPKITVLEYEKGRGIDLLEQ